MEIITLHNYEAYLLDHSDGKLNEARQLLLFEFLSAHPELEIDLHDFSLPQLSDFTHEASFKDSLKQKELFNSDAFLLDYIEGHLDAEQENKAKTLIDKDSELFKEFQRYQLTRLQPDENISYVNKNKLHKQEDDYYLNNSIIAYLENDLCKVDRIEMEVRLNHNVELKKELELYKKTVLPLNTELVFENKQALKKETKVIVWFDHSQWTSAAAAILLIVTSVIVLNVYLKKEGSQKPFSEHSPSYSPLPEKKTQTDNLTYKTEQQKTTFHQNKQFAAVNRHLLTKASGVKKSEPLPAFHEQIDTLQAKAPDELLAVLLNTNNENTNSHQLSEANKKQISFAIESELTKLSTLPEVEDEEEAPVRVISSKNSFWKKAVKLAQQANTLGIKSLNGIQKKNDQYLLSFHSFSIEKK